MEAAQLTWDWLQVTLQLGQLGFTVGPWCFGAQKRKAYLKGNKQQKLYCLLLRLRNKNILKKKRENNLSAMTHPPAQWK